MLQQTAPTSSSVTNGNLSKTIDSLSNNNNNNTNTNSNTSSQEFGAFATQQQPAAYHLDTPPQHYQPQAANYEQLRTVNPVHCSSAQSSTCSSSSASSSSSSSSNASLLMPLIHESSDLLNCDINLAHLQQMDEDEDYVEHDLNDSDNSDDEDDDDDDDDDGSVDEDDSENSDEDEDDSDEEVELDCESDEDGTRMRKLKKAAKHGGKSARGKKKSKLGHHQQQHLHHQNGTNGRLNKNGGGLMSHSYENSARNVINEQNFVTITRKNEATSEIQNSESLLLKIYLL